METGEILEIGPHKLSCSSIESSTVDQMLQGTKAKLIYSDPPWGDGNLKYWVTMNKKMTGKEFTPLSYDQLLARIYELIDNYVDGHIMIETGLRWSEKLQEDLAKRYFHVREIMLRYDGNRDNPLIYASTSPDINWTGTPECLVGAKSVKELVGAVTEKGDIVIDPCCGMGWTAQACIDNGVVFRGNEFNAKRLQKTINRFK